MGCSVNTFTRQFNDEAVDVAVKVKGGMVFFKRFYNGLNWGTDLERSHIEITGETVLIPRNMTWSPDEDASYNPCRGPKKDDGPGSGFFFSENDFGPDNKTCVAPRCPQKDPPYYYHPGELQTYWYRSGSILTKQERTWRREELDGSFMIFDEQGVLLSYGNRTGIVGKLMYDSLTGKLVGIADRDDNQVIWFERNAAGQISAVHDNQRQRVEYRRS